MSIPERIEREIVVDAPPDVVWSILTEPDQMTQWLADEVELVLQPGGDGTLRWHSRVFRSAGSASKTLPIRVERVEPPHRFSFRWEAPADEAVLAGNSMLVEFTLAVEGEGTRLRVVESGMREVQRPDDEMAHYVDEHARGWSLLLVRLASYLGDLRPRHPGE